MRRLLAFLAASTAVLCLTPPAAAHNPPFVEIRTPRDNQAVGGPTITLQLVAGSGDATTEFTIKVDGQLVDLQGKVPATSVFTNHRLAPNERRDLRVGPLADGRHTILLEFRQDADAGPRPDVAVKFRVGKTGSGLVVLVGVVVFVGALAAATIIRRRGGTQVSDEPSAPASSEPDTSSSSA